MAFVDELGRIVTQQQERTQGRTREQAQELIVIHLVQVVRAVKVVFV